MGQYQSIKDLVIDEYVSHGEMPVYEFLTQKIKIWDEF